MDLIVGVIVLNISFIELVAVSPDFFIEYLTQNVIFHVKSHITKHEF